MPLCALKYHRLYTDPHPSSFCENDPYKVCDISDTRCFSASWPQDLPPPPPPHSPGFWHCAHKHDSQDKRQAKRFCKPFMKHNEVFMEHIILKGKKLGHLGALWGDMKRSSSRRGSKGVPAVILKSFSFLSDTFSTDEKISFLMYVWQAPTAVY